MGIISYVNEEIQVIHAVKAVIIILMKKSEI